VSGDERQPFTSGAAEAARLAREVQDLGFDAARIVVQRFVDVFAQYAAANGGAAGTRREDAPPPAQLGWSDESARRLRSDVQRATDAYMSMLTQFSEASLRFFDATTRWWQPPRAGHDELRLPDVAPGGRVSARLWLHNTTGSATADLRPWCPRLTSHTGVSLPGTAVTCAPARIDRLDGDASREVLVTVAVGEDAPPGTYHGQLLVDGLPDVVFPLRARVLDVPNRR